MKWSWRFILEKQALQRRVIFEKYGTEGHWGLRWGSFTLCLIPSGKCMEINQSSLTFSYSTNVSHKIGWDENIFPGR